MSKRPKVPDAVKAASGVEKLAAWPWPTQSPLADEKEKRVTEVESAAAGAAVVHSPAANVDTAIMKANAQRLPPSDTPSSPNVRLKSVLHRPPEPARPVTCGGPFIRVP
jgi:hypothetical protein